MKHLIIAEPFIKTPHCQIMLDEIKKSIEEGNEVHVAYCTGNSHFCINNQQCSERKCRVCRFMTEYFLHSVRNQVSLQPFFVDAKKIVDDAYPFETMQDLKKITYRSVDIGYAVMSTYVTMTRELIEAFSLEQRLFFNRLLNITKVLSDRAWEIFDAVQPELVSVFNGRQMDIRPFFDVAQANKIPMRSNEIVLASNKNQEQYFKKIIYHNSLPHDVDENAKIVESLWQMKNEPEKSKIEKGRQFFEKKRNGIPAGDAFNPGQSFVFIAGQKKGLLPDSWDHSKKNIVIFNSSEDEYAAINRDFDSYSLFQSQYEGVEFIAKTLLDHPEYHVVLRVHPNMKTIPYHYHTALYELEEKYHNLTVIKAISPCSTYDVMDAADKVITFGSTMGAEAVYWGKPVILIGPALYRKVNLSYNPKTKEEFAELLLSDLKPMDSSQAVKYGYYITNRDSYCEDVKYIDTSIANMRIFSKHLHYYREPKLFRSSCLVHLVKKWFLSAKYPAKIELPYTLFGELKKEK